MIIQFKDKRDRLIYEGQQDKRFQPAVCRKITDKLRAIDAAEVIDDLKFPPSNKLHPLIKDRDGQHAIWVNSAVRICFTWNDGKVIIEYVGNYH
ncbi:type II toxin-antitoxin system RelE/ParE family toxin [Leptospira santarosai]|uniref:type II toxin-antitoxin system RelE/ParE family toxin n=1 Tax=Leptospira santarosai TaxID=28183 RepID=UPI0005181A13|nr:type II toxin-antitoxin system RelE/ParE family toxin [Leptospira santarosai]MDI7226787.1 type II toxin-antitoxin system RelE/ParE family toxin [Leptospira santarosai]